MFERVIIHGLSRTCPRAGGLATISMHQWGHQLEFQKKYARFGILPF